MANLILPVGVLKNDEYLEVTYLLKKLNPEIRSSISEVIMEDETRFDHAPLYQRQNR
jgi:hypothetical protein